MGKAQFTSKHFQDAWDTYQRQRQCLHVPERWYQGTCQDCGAEIPADRMTEMQQWQAISEKLLADPDLLTRFIKRQQDEIRIYRHAMEEIAKHGCHHDIHPTFMWGDTSQQVMQFVHNYFRSMDDRVREIAKKTIDKANERPEIL